MRYGLLFTGAAALALAAGCTPEMQPTTGASDYAQFCADCHGPRGKGDGPAAAGMTPRPADLTTIALRNGGTFPRLQVMSRIYGYTMGSSESPMPAFGELLEGRTVLYDAGDGVQTPTPWRLVALQQHLAAMQQRGLSGTAPPPAR